MFLVVKTSFLFGPHSSAERRIVPTVTGCALIEVGRYLFVLVFTLLVLDSRSVIVAVGLSLILMLVRVPQKLELVEDEIRYCVTGQSQFHTSTLLVLHPSLRPAICADARPCLNNPAVLSGFSCPRRQRCPHPSMIKRRTVNRLLDVLFLSLNP